MEGVEELELGMDRRESGDELLRSNISLCELVLSSAAVLGNKIGADATWETASAKSGRMEATHRSICMVLSH